jgi:hypothetical protein
MGKVGIVGWEDTPLNDYEGGFGGGYRPPRPEIRSAVKPVPGDNVKKLMVDCGIALNGALKEGVPMKRIKSGVGFAWECGRRCSFSERERVKAELGYVETVTKGGLRPIFGVVDCMARRKKN